jgi:hypothetical protein
MPRRPAPTPLRLHPGPTPPRNFVKFTLPSKPQQTFYPSVSNRMIPVEKQSASHSRTHSRSSSVSSQEEGSPPSLVRRDAITVAQLPASMTQGPKEGGVGGVVMPEYRPASLQSPLTRKIGSMGPWEYSKKVFTEEEVSALIAAPARAMPNPFPVTW